MKKKQSYKILWKKSKDCASCTTKSNNQILVLRWMPKTQGENLKIIIIESCCQKIFVVFTYIHVVNIF